MVNDDRKPEKRRAEHPSLYCTLVWWSPTLSKNSAPILNQKAQGCPGIQTGQLQLKSIALPPRPKAAGVFTVACPSENVTLENVAHLFWRIVATQICLCAKVGRNWTTASDYFKDKHSQIREQMLAIKNMEASWNFDCVFLCLMHSIYIFSLFIRELLKPRAVQ